MATKPFYGDPTKAAPIFNRYAVLLGGLTATIPDAPADFTLNDPAAGSPVVDQWDPVGALVEENPFTDGAESLDVTTHTAAGHGVYAKTYRNQEETIEFTSLETTLVTLGIIYDASGLTEVGGAISGKLKQRDPAEKFRIAFQRENATEMERRVSENYAQINSITRNRSNGRGECVVSVTIYPNSDRELYDYYRGPLA